MSFQVSAEVLAKWDVDNAFQLCLAYVGGYRRQVQDDLAAGKLEPGAAYQRLDELMSRAMDSMWHSQSLVKAQALGMADREREAGPGWRPGFWSDTVEDGRRVTMVRFWNTDGVQVCIVASETFWNDERTAGDWAAYIGATCDCHRYEETARAVKERGAKLTFSEARLMVPDWFWGQVTLPYRE